MCCPALILPDLFVSSPHHDLCLRTATCARSPAALLRAACRWRGWWSKGEQGWSDGMCGVGLPSLSVLCSLCSPLFQPDFLPVSHTKPASLPDLYIDYSCKIYGLCIIPGVTSAHIPLPLWLFPSSPQSCLSLGTFLLLSRGTRDLPKISHLK